MERFSGNYIDCYEKVISVRQIYQMYRERIVWRRAGTAFDIYGTEALGISCIFQQSFFESAIYGTANSDVPFYVHRRYPGRSWGKPEYSAIAGLHGSSYIGKGQPLAKRYG